MGKEQKYWNTAFTQSPLIFDQSEFAEEVISYFPDTANVLDIGCGLGADSLFFAQGGCSVVGIDFSDVAINRNQEKFSDQPNLKFMQCDTQDPLPFQNSEFDAIYARLSLHYFPDSVTKEIFSEVKRVLMSGGIFCFECKSTKDPKYGQGEKIADDMYELEGHTRHFFSEEYARKLLNGNFEIVKLWEVDAEIYEKNAAVIKVVARKI